MFHIVVLIQYDDQDQKQIKVFQPALTPEIALVRVGTRIGKKFREAKITEATILEANNSNTKTITV